MTQAQYFLTMFILIGIGYWIDIKDYEMKSQRKHQSKNLLKENIVKDKLDEILSENVKPSKKREVELFLQQSGYGALDFVDFIFISGITGILTGLVFWKTLNNIILGIIFVFIGAVIPKQIMGYVRNKRLEKLDGQVGTFMRIVIKRYEATDSFYSALSSTAEELRGEQPISDEIDKTLAQLELTGNTEKALNDLADRTGNRFLHRFAGYYGVVAHTGNSETRIRLLSEAYNQYEENRQLNRKNKKEISEVVRILYIFVGAVPAVAAFQATQDPKYMIFMTETLLGKLGTLYIILSMLGVVWIINNKIGGPLD